MPQYMAEARDYLSFIKSIHLPGFYCQEKIGEIWLCTDYHKLNSIMIRGAFLLSWIDEVLQTVNNCQWFTSFELVQGYLQMPVAELDIHMRAFRTRSFSLYEFTYVPFGLSNSGSIFCCLMEMCLGDQQFVTFLLFLDDICVCCQYRVIVGLNLNGFL